MNWTERQLEAIKKRGSTLLVSAAAGSGKTAVLVERIKRLLLEEGTGIDRMLVVTFTNAAAAEMKEKISRMLTKALADPETDPAKRSFLRHQHDILGRASICTFHSFALDLLRRYYHVIGVDPDLRICDESNQSIFKRDAMDELFEDRFESRDPDLLYFLDRYAGSRSNEPAKAMIRAMHTFLQSLPDPDGWLKDAAEGKLFDAEKFTRCAAELAEEELSAVCSYLKMASYIFDSVPEGALANISAKHADDMASAEAILAAFERSPEEGFKAVSEGIAWTAMRTNKQEKDLFETVKEPVGALRKKAKKRFDDLRSTLEDFSLSELETEKDMLLPPLKALCALTADFSGRYNEKKLARRCLDFSDIEHMALRILENEEVCAECRERFDAIFIDEYQDSNLVQESLIQRICRPDNVFMVGDVKQSIYKFRLAEPELFLAKYRDIKAGKLAGSEVVDLNSNFRSKGPVIAYINGIFEKIMTEASCGIVYDSDASLVEGAPYDGPLRYEPEFFLISRSMPEEAETPEDEEIGELKSDELEALNAVRVIKKYLGKPIYDSASGSTRPLRYADMAILLKSVKNRGEVYYRTLLDAGIPVQLDRSEGYFDVMEIQVFMNLLRLIDNRQKDVPLLSVLRFPAFGFRADDLAAVRVWADAAYPAEDGRKQTEYNRAFTLYAAEGPEGELRDRCAAFLEKLDSWRVRASFLPLGDFLWELLNETCIIDFCAALPAGKQRRANLSALINKAENYEAENASGLYGFINYIDTISSNRIKINTGQARIDPGGSDAVSIMTIHKSKGLEFPFVLTAGLGNKLFQNSGETSQALFDRDLGAALRIVDPDKGLYADPASFGLIKRRKKREELAETIRVLYVALTRAKDILVLSGTAQDAFKKLQAAEYSVPGDVSGCNTYLDMVLPVLGRGRTTVVLPSELASDPYDCAPREAELRKALENGFVVKKPSVPPEEISGRLGRRYFEEPSEKQKRKYSVSQLAEIERAGLEYLPRVLSGEEGAEEKEENASVYRDRKIPAFISSEKKLSGAEKGTAYHSVMEHIPFTAENKSPEDVAAFIEELAAKNILSPAEASAVDPERISAFFSSDVGKRAVTAPEVFKEAPFVYRKEYMGREILVQGTIDCYFEEADGIVLVDYKSNYVDKADLEAQLEELRQSYLPQLSLYREAIEHIQGKKVKEAVLYLFSTGGELRVD